MAKFVQAKPAPGYSPFAIKQILRGNETQLNTAFIWCETPEGRDYWQTQYLRILAGHGLTIRARYRLRQKLKNLRNRGLL